MYKMANGYVNIEKLKILISKIKKFYQICTKSSIKQFWITGSDRDKIIIKNRKSINRHCRERDNDVCNVYLHENIYEFLTKHFHVKLFFSLYEPQRFIIAFRVTVYLNNANKYSMSRTLDSRYKISAMRVQQLMFYRLTPHNHINYTFVLSADVTHSYDNCNKGRSRDSKSRAVWFMNRKQKCCLSCLA
ncbi:hypothetical protein AGLY_015371 [Aphis glycines]|uniref:Uncharacterized protein n=1 Tax=Aphis glycines TaxID=307491 RepID=A0A6G0T1F3_APHGL|nr:hypothetical protein AGLY_015371 [Aphis glycines]